MKSTAKTTRTEEIYESLKFADRMTPGRTPWQTLRKRAEAIAASETLTDADRLPLMDANSSNPLEASIARLRAETLQVLYNGRWQTVRDHRPGMVYIDANGGHWIVAAGMKVRTI